MSFGKKPNGVFTQPLPKKVGAGFLSGFLKTGEYNSHSAGLSIEQLNQPVEIMTSKPKFDLNKLKVRWGGKWVRHKRGFYQDLLSYGPPYYDYFSISKSEHSEDIKSELIRFLLTLELWETTPGAKELSAQEIWLGSLQKGPAYTEEIDDYFALSWRKREIDSYNFVFPSRFMPRWEEGTDNLKLCQEATYATEGVLDEFRFTLISLLKEIPDISKIVLPSDDSILFERSTTTSYVHSTKETMPQWEASLKCNVFNTHELIGKRCVVPVYPGGLRDTIIADISANNSIRWLERSFRHILEYVPESAVSLYSTTFQKRMEDVVNQKGSHVLRDIKKCGLTYNSHDLFSIVREELKEFIPDSRWDRLNIYSNMTIVDDDEQYKALRGYGLGMANHLVTLCNIVIHRMARNALAEQDNSFKLKCIAGNDDEDVVIFGTPHHRKIAKEYMEIENDIHGALGNLINQKKSIVKPYGLFYEKYNKSGWENKESLVCNAIACAYLAPSIRVAKHYIYSQSDRFSSKWARNQLRHLATFWGGEFFEVQHEIKAHFEIGGWLDTRSLGLKTTLRDIDYLSQFYRTERLSLAIQTCYQFLKPPSPSFKTEGMVSNFMYFGRACKAPEKIQIYTLNEDDLKWYYKRLTKFNRNYDSRISKYESRVKAKNIKENIFDLHEFLLKREPWYAIPDSLVNECFPHREIILDYKSELLSHGEERLKNEIKKLQGFEYTLFEEDDNFKWNPTVPPKVTNTKIETDSYTQLRASRFSNSGYLPILEYFQRTECYPNIISISSRSRPPALPKERDKYILKTSFYSKRKRKKEDLDNIDIPVQNFDINELLKSDYTGNFKDKALELDDKLVFPRGRNPHYVEPEEEKAKNDELLDNLQEGGGISTMVHDLYKKDPNAKDIFDEDSDSEFEGGFFGMEEE